MSYQRTGRLTRDPEFSTSKKGISICRFGIVFNDGFGEYQTSFFVECTAFKKTAEYIAQRAKKGDLAEVTGVLYTDSWEDKEGNRRSSTKMNINNFTYFGMVVKREASEEDAGFSYSKDSSKEMPVDDEMPF